MTQESTKDAVRDAPRAASKLLDTATRIRAADPAITLSSPVSNAKKRARARYYSYASLFLVIVFFAGIRFRLRTMPLERDEGEYAYVGQLMLQGIPPYKLAYTMKLPGTHAAYALIMALLGQTPAGIHIGLLLINSATILLVYMLAARLSGQLVAIVAAASYALLSASFSVFGFAAHATHFVVISALAGILLLLKAAETERRWQLFASGFLLGLAFLMKQQGITFAVLGGLYLFQRRWPRLINWNHLVSEIGAYVLGAVLPFGLTCAVLLAAGVFKTFWFWIFTYAEEYASTVRFSRGVQNFTEAFSFVAGPSVGVWIIAALGLTTLAWHREKRRHVGLIGGFLLCSFLAVCPGLFFREHYFVVMLPVVALLAGIAVSSATEMLDRAGYSLVWTAVPTLLFSVAFGFSMFQERASLFEMDPSMAFQKTYGENPFPEAVVIARYLDAHTSRNDRIAVLGSEPEIYFYAKRRSASGFIYMYSLTEQQKYSLQMQEQMIHEVESAKVKFLVVVKSPVSWLPRSGSLQALSLSLWALSYVGSQYELVGVAERVADNIEYHWDDGAKAYQDSQQNTVLVYKRKS